MSPFGEFKDKPVLTLLIALLIAAIGTIGAMNQNTLNNIRENQISAENRLWTKLDRVSNLMIEREKAVMADLRDVQKLAICHDRDIAEIKERIRGHIENGNATSTGRKGGGS